MKNFFYLMVFIFLFSCKENVNRHEDLTSEEDTIETGESINNSSEPVSVIKSIDDIKKEHSYIISKLKNGNIDSTSMRYDCQDEKKGELVYFYDEGQLRLIRHSYNEYSHFSATDEYFLKDGDPFFIFYNHVVWNFVGQGETKEEITEKRYYLIDREPIKCLEKEFIVLSNDEKPTKAHTIPNNEIECAQFEPVLEKFDLLFELRKQEGDFECLENFNKDHL